MRIPTASGGESPGGPPALARRKPKYIAVPYTERNNNPQISAASAILRRRVSSQVRRAISSVPRMSSTRPLVFAHDLDEPFFERLSAATQLVERDAAADEPARELRQHGLGIGVHAHEALVAGDSGAECGQAFEQRVVDLADAQLDVERASGAPELKLVHDEPVLHERDAVARGLDLAEQVRVQEHGGATVAQLVDDVAHEQAPERIEARRRLIEEDQLRRTEQRGREPGALRHALAVCAQRPVRRVLEPDAQEQPLDARAESARRKPQQAPVEMQQLARVQAIVKTKVLGQEAHARAGRGIAERRA